MRCSTNGWGGGEEIATKVFVGVGREGYWSVGRERGGDEWEEGWTGGVHGGAGEREGKGGGEDEDVFERERGRKMIRKRGC